MGLLRQWLRQPQKLRLWRALFQLHLWAGIGLGLYVLFISVTGSAIVFRRDLGRVLTPRITPSSSVRLTGAELRRDAQVAYPGYQVASVAQGRSPRAAAIVTLERPGAEKQRYFDPYPGRDLGDVLPPALRVMEWLVDLHDNLLAGRHGRLVNGVAAALVALLCCSGALIWWPGIRTWRQSLTLRRRSDWKRFNWELHSATGFWTFPLLLMWVFTGFYFAFPIPVTHFLDLLLPASPSAPLPPSQIALAWLVKLHFGRFGSIYVRVLWVLLGLSPVVLLVTGTLMWWHRVFRPRPRPPLPIHR